MPDNAPRGDGTTGTPFALTTEMTTGAEAEFTPVAIRTRKGRDLKVQMYQSDDFGTLVQMYKVFQPKRVAQGLPPPDVPRIAHWLDLLQQKSQSLLAVDGDRITGHTILCPIRADAVEFTIFVHQDYREEGLGTALSRLMLEWAQVAGYSRVYLTTETSNIRALRLFRKLGFQTTSSSGDEVEMKLDLPASSIERPQAA